MAHDLKLGLYKISIRQSNKRARLPFKELFNKVMVDVDKASKYKAFLESYSESFEGAFKSPDAMKSVALLKWDSIPEKDIICGSIIGGLSNIERHIYKHTNIKKIVGTLNRDNIAVLPFFFMVWMPPDSTIGILLFQYYSSSSVFGAFNSNFRDFFSVKFGLTFRTFPFVPEKMQEEFFKKSVISKIALIKKKVDKSARGKFGPLLSEEEDFSVRLEISNLSEKPSEFKRKVREITEAAKGFFFKANLEEIGFSDNQFDMRIYYENSNGKRTYATLEKNFEILPTIDVDADCKEMGKDSVDYDKIKKYCFNLLQDLKELPDFNNNE